MNECQWCGEFCPDTECVFCLADKEKAVLDKIRQVFGRGVVLVQKRLTPPPQGDIMELENESEV